MHRLEISDVHVGAALWKVGRKGFSVDLAVKDLPSNAGGEQFQS